MSSMNVMSSPQGCGRFKQDPGHLLLYGLNLGLREQGEEGTREVVGVGVGVPQLVGNGVEEEVATYTEEE